MAKRKVRARFRSTGNRSQDIRVLKGKIASERVKLTAMKRLLKKKQKG